MTNKEVQQLLQEYPDDMPVKILVDHNTKTILDFDSDRILHTSDTAYVDDEPPAEMWDTEDGRIMLGDGQQYLLINPIIL